MKVLEYVRSKPRIRKGLIAGGVTVLVYILFGFLALPPILKSVLSKTLSETLHRKAEIRDIRINPLELSVSVRGLTISERDAPGTWISAEEVFANLQLASVIRGGAVLNEIRLSRPYVNIVRRTDGSYNFTDLIDNFTKKPEKESKPLKYSFNNIQIVDGSVDFEDGPKKTRHEVRGIHLSVPFVSNLPYFVDRYIQPSFEAVVNGDPVSLKGKSKPFSESHETTVDVNIKDLDIPHYLSYLPEQREYEISSGFLDVKAVISFAQHKGKPPAVRVEGNVTLREFRLQGKGKSPMLHLPRIEVEISPSDIVAREFRVASLTVKDPGIDAVIDRSGKLNLLLLSTRDGKGNEKGERAGTLSGEADPASPETKVFIEAIRLSGGKVGFRDLTTDPPVELSLDRLQLTADNVTTEKDRKATFSFATLYNRQGTVSLGGTFAVDPPSMNARLQVKALPIGPMQPYFTEKVKLLLTGGAISAEGDVSIDAPKEKPVRAGFRGEVSVNNFSSLDKALEKEFLRFTSLHFGGVEVGYNPTNVAIREISLTDFRSRIIVNPDGTLNVQGIVAKEGAGRDNAALKPAADTAAGNAAKAPGIPVRIDTVTLQGGAVNFSDRYIKPNYSASLVEVGGRVSGLSSEENKLADIDLRGKLENSAPLEIVGKINPLSKDLFLDLKVDFRDMDLSPLSPYSGRYVGYGIQKGKLTLTLKYRIEKRKLESENKIFLDQFTFGDEVDSPDATKLPVRLAVALLKDRSGEIHLDLPVTGSIDDPEFSIWGVVWKIIVNLLVKAATSPFALLGAIFGGGEQLSYLEFAPGVADIPAAEEGKLGNLEKALHDRPALKLEIEGHVDMEKDREGMRQLIFRRKVAARKLAELVNTGQPAPALDNVRVETAEYPEYLARAYKVEKFPKPRNIIGMAKDLPVPEMEKLMLTHIQVTDDRLRQLALGRASHVRDRLVASGKVESGRIFLVEPKTLPPERKEKLRDSRVDFRIK
jgi:hypothetical protein